MMRLQNVLSRFLLMIPVACAGCLSLAGCSEGGARTAPVKGVVSYLGKPLPYGTITFIPDGNAPPATGIIQPDGSYTLTTYKEGDGAVPGKHTVMVVAVKMQEDRLPEDRSPIPPPIIPNKYLSNTTSDLKVEVKDEDNIIDLKLTGKLK